MNKFRNKKVTHDGYSFASKLEAAVFTILKSRENAGELELVQVQDHITLTKAKILYIADFKCIDKKTNEFFWVEAKGYSDQKWPLKRRLWKFYGPGRLEIWGGNHFRPSLTETLIVEEEK